MDQKLEAKQQILEFTEGLQAESFKDVMTTADAVNLAYKTLFPDASENQTYEEMWANIRNLTTSKG
jgi:uncharacterized protein with HEPN domain